MNRQIKKVNMFIANTHVLVILITIIICSSLWFFISPLPLYLTFNFKYLHVIIPIAFVVLFKLIVSRLPYPYKEGILRRLSGNWMCFFYIIPAGVVSSYMLAMAINAVFSEAITITKIDEIFDYPRKTYFFVDGGMGEASSIETSYSTHVSSQKGEVSYNIDFLYGGFVGDSKDIFIFSDIRYRYGEEYSVSDEIKKSKFSEKIQKTKMNDFTKNGGYIYRLPKFQFERFKNRITDDAFKAHAHIRETLSLLERAGFFAAFSFMFGFLALMVPEQFLKQRNK